MDNKEKLLEIFNNDPLGLLDVKPTPTAAKTEEERLVSSFREINTFIHKHGRHPEKSMDIHERKLHSRLEAIRGDKTKKLALIAYDEHDLLDLSDDKSQEVHSIDDIFSGDALGILDGDGEDIFKIEHVPQQREEADYIARRKECKEFDIYEPLFKQCQADLKAGKRKLVKFNEKYLVDKTFFVLKGMLGYLVKRDVSKGKFSKIDGRIYCVFENGTESNMLFRSLGKGLYEDGYMVTEHEEKTLDRLSQIKDEDNATGYIYILKSLSDNPQIKEMKNLYKIGFSRVPVEDRIGNAKNETTYLMADVEVIAEYQCYNMNPQKFEQLLHNFFGKVCLNIDIFDSEGNRHTPREWFQVPLDVVDEAIDYILSGEIVN